MTNQVCCTIVFKCKKFWGAFVTMTLFVVINIIVMLGLMALLYMMQKNMFLFLSGYLPLWESALFLDSLCILYMVRLQKRLRRHLIGLILQAAAM